jgi:hypothetical protein
MRIFKYFCFVVTLGVLVLPPLCPNITWADDDWEDRWEDYQDAREEAMEEAEERWEDEQEAYEDLREDGVIMHRHHAYYPYHGNRHFEYSPQRYYRYDGGPVYRSYYRSPRVYRHYDDYYDYHQPPAYYGGYVEGGPARVYYGRHGSVQVGPLFFTW